MIFDLSKVLSISNKGDFQDTGTIEVTPPNMDHFNAITDFEQLFMGSVVSAGNLFKDDKDKNIEVEEEKEEEKSALEKLKNNTPSASDIRMLITISQEIKIKDLFQAFKKVVFKTAFVDIDAKLKLKETHFDKMGIDDSLRFLCEYASFFTFPSLLGGKQEETSGSETSVT